MGFFAISGYLIVISRGTSSSFSSFVVKRILRIFPALITVLVLSALVVGPELSELSIAQYFSHRQTWSYVAMI